MFAHGLQAHLRGRQGPLGPAGGFAGQLDRPPQERRRRGHPAADLRPARRPVQLRGYRLIRSRRRRVSAGSTSIRRRKPSSIRAGTAIRARPRGRTLVHHNCGATS